MVVYQTRTDYRTKTIGDPIGGVAMTGIAGKITAAQFSKLAAIAPDATYTFAPSNAAASTLATATAVLSGATNGGTNAALINAAIAAVGAAGGGRVHIAEGLVYKEGPIVNNWDNVTLSAVYGGTFITEASGSVTGGLMVGYEPVTAGSTITTSPATITMRDTSKLAASGTVPIYANPGDLPTVATYTGKTATTLTGVTIVTGSVVLTTASYVGIREVLGMKLVDCKFDGNYSASSGTAIGALISGSLCKSYGSEFRSFRGDGWYLQSFDGIVVNYENFLFDSYGRANGGNQVRPGTKISNSEFLRCFAIGAGAHSASSPNRGTDGFHIEGPGNKFTMCHPYFNAQDGCQIRSTASSTEITGGEWETNTRYSINAVSVAQLTITGARFYGSDDTELVFNGTTGCKAVGCSFYGLPSTVTKAVVFTGASECALIAPYFNGSGASALIRAVSIEGASANCEVSGMKSTSLPGGFDIGLSSVGRNDIHDNHLRYGIIESGTADNNNIHHNTMDGVVTNPTIVVVGANTRVGDNIGYKTLQTGGVTVTAGTNNSVSAAVTLGGAGGGCPARMLLTCRSGMAGATGMYWQPITTTQNSGSTITLPQASITVADTSAFPAAGVIQVTSSAGVQRISYTSKDATHFLGCATATVASLSGTVAQGVTITSGDHVTIALIGTNSSSTQLDWAAHLFDL